MPLFRTYLVVHREDGLLIIVMSLKAVQWMNTS